MNDAAKPNGPPPRERWAKGYEDNITSMRDAGKWAIGVIAGILLAATNLSGFGKLYPDQWRFWLAVAAAAVVVTAIGRIVFLFLHVQVGEEMDWEKLTPAQLDFVRDYGLMRDSTSFTEFRERQRHVLDEYSRVRASIGATALVFPQQHNFDQLSRQQDLSDMLTDMAWIQREVEALLGWRPARERFERARNSLLWLGIFAAIASMTLVWAVNPRESPSQTVVVLSTQTVQDLVSPVPSSQE